MFRLGTALKLASKTADICLLPSESDSESQSASNSGRSRLDEIRRRVQMVGEYWERPVGGTKNAAEEFLKTFDRATDRLKWDLTERWRERRLRLLVRTEEASDESDESKSQASDS